MHFQNATPTDIPVLLELYKKGSQFQQNVFGKSWQSIDTVRVETEIRENRLWKIVDEESIACIFSVVYSDPLLWQERNADPAMYIHRIVTNPDFRGRGYIGKITAWARDHAKTKRLRFVRLDTWADSDKLVGLYVKNGYRLVSTIEVTASKATPMHYVGDKISLFQIDISSDPQS